MAETEATEQITQVPDSDSSEDVSTTTTPAVLNINSPPSSSDGATGGGERVTTSTTNTEETSLTESQKATPPTIPGLTEMLNEWQISGIPEEQQFFSTSEGNVFEAAVKAVKSHFGEADSVIKKAWLLTEIDHWDLEKERVLILTNANLVVVKYNFIQQMVEELKYIPLGSIKKISVGKFTYPYSYGFSRSGEGVKIWWGNSNLSFGDKWNPFSTSVPYTILKSHILVTRKQSNNPMLMFNELPEILNQAVKEFHSRVSTGGASPDIPLVEEDISFDYYLGLTALVHNQSFLGFFKKRGAVNW